MRRFTIYVLLSLRCVKIAGGRQTRHDTGNAPLVCSLSIAEVPIVRQFSWLLLLLILPAPVVQAQNPRSSRDFVKRGLTRFSKGDLDGAINDYNRAVEMDSRLAEAHINRRK